MKRIGIVLMVIGIALFTYSFQVDKYTDADAYSNAYQSIDREKVSREESFNQFHLLREKYLSNKFNYQDYGVTLIILGVFITVLMRAGWNSFSAPNANWKIVLLGFSSGILSVAGFVGDLFLEFFRGSFPHWADSLGIPLSGVPIISFIFIGWAAIHLLGMNGRFEPGANISNMGLKGLNLWYSFIVLITLVIVVLSVYDGFFWFVAPGLFWLYFYLSILAGRKSANKKLNMDAEKNAASVNKALGK